MIEFLDTNLGFPSTVSNFVYTGGTPAQFLVICPEGWCGRQCHDGRRYVIVESFEILPDRHRLPEDGMSQRNSQLGCLVQFV